MPQCPLVVCEGVSHSWSAGVLMCAGCLTLYSLSDLLSDCAGAVHTAAPQGELLLLMLWPFAFITVVCMYFDLPSAGILYCAVLLV